MADGVRRDRPAAGRPALRCRRGARCCSPGGGCRRCCSWSAPLGAAAVTRLVKQLVRRERPPEMLSAAASEYGFPSGHLAHGTAAVAVVVALLLPVLGRGGRARPGRGRGLVALVVTGAAQLVLARHYPSDLLAGAAARRRVGRGAARDRGQSSALTSGRSSSCRGSGIAACGSHPHRLGRPGRQPPVPPAEQRHQRRHQQRSDDGGVEQDADAQRCGEHLDVGARRRPPGRGTTGTGSAPRRSPAGRCGASPRPRPGSCRRCLSYSSRIRARMKTS